tara:strand:+ start:229 stop:612 length:384 start_codon:yes stop_codon:yes gene_type:complete
MYEFTWFIGGAVAYKLLSNLLGIGQVAIIFQSLQYNILTLLANMTEDISYIKALKYKTMAEAKVDSNKIKQCKLSDEEFFERWKGECLSNIYSSVPNYIRLSFESWEEGMDLLSKYYKDRLHEQKKE